MVKSMTGYGRSRETLHQRDITVEVRSVNNRFLDCTVKMPRAYVFAEDAVKTRVRSAVSRGKVDVFVTIDASAADVSVVTVNEPLARGYFQALTQLKSMFSLEGDVTPMTLAKLPDVLTVTKAEEDLETVAADICQVLDKALAAYNTMRAVEGRRLAEDIAGRLVTIETAVGRVEQQSPQTVAAYRERLEKKMREVLASTTMDEGRILTEAAIFADKVAVDEETVRLRSHVAQLRSMLEAQRPTGKDMDFLMQEFNRECNTIGSKCNDLAVTQDVVAMKAEVERSANRSRTSSKGGTAVQLVNIGFGNLVSVGRLIAVVSPDSAPIKRLIQESRDRGMLIDATYGRKTAAVLVMDSDHVVLSALPAEKLGPRLGLSAEDFMQEEI